MLWQLLPSSGLPAGLTSTALDAAGTFLVKTNLSTETQSGVQPLAQRERDVNEGDGPAGTWFASITDAGARAS